MSFFNKICLQNIGGIHNITNVFIHYTAPSSKTYFWIDIQRSTIEKKKKLLRTLVL